MIVLRLELWKKGDPNNVIELGRTYITNVGGTDTRGEYKVAVARKDKLHHEDVIRRGIAARHGEVKDYPRLSYNVWRLVIRALRSAFPEEN